MTDEPRTPEIRSGCGARPCAVAGSPRLHPTQPVADREQLSVTEGQVEGLKGRLWA
ncbi:hypothetical protein GCM10010277_33580 [Streptomyces longisporoflavus]|nr:hypothetical protein GCM10010277_33580 [Streptomyces longisporoflavus]